MILRLISFILFMMLCVPAWSATLYIGTNGGNGTQCNGLFDISLATAQANGNINCKLNHPAWAFPPPGQSTTRQAVFGDIVVIQSDSYRMGCQNATTCLDSNFNYTVSSTCNQFASYDCYMGAIPSNVTIVGCTPAGCGCTYNWGGVTNCSTTRPELWGAGNVREIINVGGSSNVTIKDLELTDRSTCFHATAIASKNCSPSPNGSNQPTFLSSRLGIEAGGATNLILTGVNIHGVGYHALFTNNLNTMTITGSNLDYSTTGISNDTTGSCTTCGLGGIITIDKSSSNGSGCQESTTTDGTVIPQGCCSQSQGCSSFEALSLTDTGGVWNITDSDFSYNSADGVDLLYLNRGTYNNNTGSVTFKRSRAEGNAGNSIKGPNAMTVEDSYLLGNCSYFQGQSITYDDSTFDHCRSNTGSPIAIEFKSGDTRVPSITNTTMSSNGNIVLLTSGTCTTGTNVISRNNIIVGGRQWNDDSSNPRSPSGGNKNTTAYYDGFPDGQPCNNTFVDSNNVCVGNFNPWPTEITPCSGTNSTSVTNAGLSSVGTILQGPYSSPGYFNAKNYSNVLRILQTSPAVTRGNLSFGDSVDFNNFNRGASWDSGAVEWDTTSTITCNNNNIKDSTENCDGIDLNSQTCATVLGAGYTGTLACDSNCNFNTSSCIAPGGAVCGNGVIEGTEQCDDNNTTNSDCCSSICETEVSGYERLLTYTETDPSSRLALTTHSVVVTNMDRNTNTTLVKDYGASHFGDFTTTMRVDLTSCAAPNGTCYTGIWALSSALRTSITNMDVNLDGVALTIYQNDSASGSAYEWGLENLQAGGGVGFVDTAPPSTRYVRIVRSGSMITATLYPNSTYTGPLGTMSLVSAPTTLYRYFYPVVSVNDGNTDASWNFTVQNINIGESVLSCGGAGGSASSGNVRMNGRCGQLGRWNMP